MLPSLLSSLLLQVVHLDHTSVLLSLAVHHLNLVLVLARVSYLKDCGFGLEVLHLLNQINFGSFHSISCHEEARMWCNSFSLQLTTPAYAFSACCSSRLKILLVGVSCLLLAVGQVHAVLAPTVELLNELIETSLWNSPQF